MRHTNEATITRLSLEPQSVFLYKLLWTNFKWVGQHKYQNPSTLENLYNIIKIIKVSFFPIASQFVFSYEPFERKISARVNLIRHKSLLAQAN